MDKPKILMPFIYVYRLVYFIFKMVFNLFKYFNLGLFLTLFIFIDIIVSLILYFIKLIIFGILYSSYVVYCVFRSIFNKFMMIPKAIISLFRYTYLGFLVVCFKVYSVFRWTLYGMFVPAIALMLLYRRLVKANKESMAQFEVDQQKRLANKERNKLIQEENKRRLMEARQKEKDELAKQKLEQREKDVYINENLTLEKKKISEHLNDFLGLFKTLGKKIKDLFVNNHFVRNAKNKRDINHQALLLDFEGADAEKSEEKVMYKYVARSPEGKIIKGYFPAFSKVEVHSFLLSEGNEVYSIETNKWIQRLHGSGAEVNKNKIKTKDLIFFTTQLSTYIKAGIPLVDALKILSRQFKNKTYAKIFRSMIYDLTMGDNFSTAMDKQGNAFPRLFINMAKTAEMTGELPEVLDDMADYFTETDKTRKQMITAMTYPAIIFVFAIAAIIFIMVWVVPRFVEVYEGIDGAEIPGITVFVMNVSAFLQKNYIYLILGAIALIVILVYLYKNVKLFKTFVQWLLMHIPVIGNVIIYNEVTMFTKTFASLLAHNVFITDSMEILNKITNNEIYKMLILDTITNLAKGERLSLAFKDHWAFPLPAYEMITTGERTGQLPEMMVKVSDYYQELHRNSVTRIKTFVEPIMILFLTVVVGGVVLAIVIPMFSVYNAVQIQ